MSQNINALGNANPDQGKHEDVTEDVVVDPEDTVQVSISPVFISLSPCINSREVGLKISER